MIATEVVVPSLIRRSNAGSELQPCVPPPGSTRIPGNPGSFTEGFARGAVLKTFLGGFPADHRVLVGLSAPGSADPHHTDEFGTSVGTQGPHSFEECGLLEGAHITVFKLNRIPGAPLAAVERAHPHEFGCTGVAPPRTQVV